MKDVIVAKFGGSSLADSFQFVKVKNIIESDRNRRFIVPSAPGKRSKEDTKITDLLYECYELASKALDIDEKFTLIEERYQEICHDLNLDIDISNLTETIKKNIVKGASKDYAASRGEYLNGIILSKYLGIEFIDAGELIIFKDDGELDSLLTEERIGTRLENVNHAVIPGFYGAKENGDIVTFSRGGSDFTGAIIANGVRASLYENWTDVSGFLVADPSIVDSARVIELVTYKEVRELSYMGAPVLHDEVIFPLRKHSIPINIKNTNRPEDKGTFIVDEATNPEITSPITGISGKKDFTVLTVGKTFMNSEVGFISKLASVFEKHDVSIEHIPSSIDGISVIVSGSELNLKLDKVIEDIELICKPDNIMVKKDIALIAIVGRGMARSKGITGKIFTTLAENDIRVKMISQDLSEVNIILGIENDYFDIAVKTIYQAVL